VDPQNLDDHFIQFTFSAGGLKARRSSFSSSGFYVSELFETKEINVYSEIQNSPYLSCWIRSIFTLTGG
jgi:hypothetical protein